MSDLLASLQKTVVEGKPLSLLERTPVNRNPVLVCDTCEEWRIHRFQGKAYVLPDGQRAANQSRELIFACIICTTRRRFGLED